jgi:hypothetical protein
MKKNFNAKAQRSEGAGEFNSFNPPCVLAALRLGVEFP